MARATPDQLVAELGGTIGPMPAAPPAVRTDYRPLAREAAARHGVDPDLFERLITQESGWKPDIVSPKGAMGLGQLMPSTAKYLGVDPRDPAQNLDGAARYLREQMDRFREPSFALAAYNAGPERVAQYGGIPPFAETQNYVRSIMGSQVSAAQAAPSAQAPTDIDALVSSLGGTIQAAPSNDIDKLVAELGGEIQEDPTEADRPGLQGPQRTGDIALPGDVRTAQSQAKGPTTAAQRWALEHADELMAAGQQGIQGASDHLALPANARWATEHQAELMAAAQQGVAGAAQALEAQRAQPKPPPKLPEPGPMDRVQKAMSKASGISAAPKKGPMGLGDFFSSLVTSDGGPTRLSKKGEGLVPFVGPLASAVDAYDVVRAARRVKAGSGTRADERIIEDFQERDREAANRGTTILHDVANVVSALPAFAIEFSATGGAFTGVKTLVGEALAKIATNKATRAAATAASYVAGGIAQTAAMPQRVIAEATRRQAPTPKESAAALADWDDDFAPALARAVPDQFVEVFSERTGGLIEGPMKALAKLPLPQRITALKSAVMARWLKLNPSRTVEDFLATVREETAWNGIVGEMFEERVGETMRAAQPYLNEDGTPAPAMIRVATGEGKGGRTQATKDFASQLATEALAFAVPGAIGTLLSLGSRRDDANTPPPPPGGTGQYAPINRPPGGWPGSTAQPAPPVAPPAPAPPTAAPSETPATQPITEAVTPQVTEVSTPSEPATPPLAQPDVEEPVETRAPSAEDLAQARKANQNTPEGQAEMAAAAAQYPPGARVTVNDRPATVIPGAEGVGSHWLRVKYDTPLDRFEPTWESVDAREVSRLEVPAAAQPATEPAAPEGQRPTENAPDVVPAVEGGAYGPAAKRAHTNFKSNLSRLQANKKHDAVIALWEEFQRYYDSNDFPYPDNWRNWERAAEDAKVALDREKREGHFADPTKPLVPPVAPTTAKPASTGVVEVKAGKNQGRKLIVTGQQDKMVVGTWEDTGKSGSAMIANVKPVMKAPEAAPAPASLKDRIAEIKQWIERQPANAQNGHNVRTRRLEMERLEAELAASAAPAAEPEQTPAQKLAAKVAARIAAEEKAKAEPKPRDPAEVRTETYTEGLDSLKRTGVAYGPGGLKVRVVQRSQDDFYEIEITEKGERRFDGKLTLDDASEYGATVLADLAVQLAKKPSGPTVIPGMTEVAISMGAAADAFKPGDSVTYKGESYTVATPSKVGDRLRITRGLGNALEVDARKLETASTLKPATEKTTKKTPVARAPLPDAVESYIANLGELQRASVQTYLKDYAAWAMSAPGSGAAPSRPSNLYHTERVNLDAAEARIGSLMATQKAPAATEKKPSAKTQATVSEAQAAYDRLTDEYQEYLGTSSYHFGADEEANVLEALDALLAAEPKALAGLTDKRIADHQYGVERVREDAAEESWFTPKFEAILERLERILNREVLRRAGQQEMTFDADVTDEQIGAYNDAVKRARDKGFGEPTPNADLDARKAANAAKREELFKKLRGKLTSGVDPDDIVAMSEIMLTYVDDGITEFRRAWRQFKADAPDLADKMVRHFEVAWEELRGEVVNVATIDDLAPPADAGAPAETITDPAERVRRLFTVFKGAVLDNNVPKDPRDLRKFARGVVGGDPTTYTDEITDAVEAALTANTAEVTRDVPLIAQIRAAQADEAKLPRANRSLEKIDLQQFSTPLPLAVAAQYAADVKQGETVLEPTAGTGHLVSGLVPSRYNILVRELSERRVTLLKALGFHTTQGDYLAMTEKANADVIITNPPWGKYTKGKYGAPIALGFTPVDVAERFFAKNVRDLKDGGRIAAIMPTTMISSSSFRMFLEQHGSVRAIIQSPPGAYETRSTSVDSVLLVWDKVKTPPKPTERPSEAWTKWLDQWQTLTAVTDRAPKTWEEYADLVARIPARTEGQRDEQPSAPPIRGPVSEGRPATPTRTGTGNAAGTGGRPRPGRPQPAPDADGATPAVQPPGAPPMVAPGGTQRPGPAASLARTDTRDPTRGLSADGRVAFEHASASQHFAPYRLRSDLVGQRHPKLNVEARALAGVPYPELTLELTPGVKALVTAGRVSIEQAEQAMAAVQANIVHQHGYLAADNVGVGKSREIGLTILDLMARAQADGRDLRLMVTTKNSDTIAGLIDVELRQALLNGEEPPFDIVKVSESKNATEAKDRSGEYQPLPRYKHAIYVVDSYNVGRYRKALLDVGLHGVIGDEVHNYKNANASVGASWQTIHGQIMLTVPRAHQAFAYFTATPAQSVYDYRYLYGLREWPIDGFDQWVMMVTGNLKPEDAAKLVQDTETGATNPGAVIKNASDTLVGGDADHQGATKGQDWRTFGGGGENIFNQILTPAEAEQIPREWKMKGKFSSRDLWREGTEFSVVTKEMPKRHEQRYDQFAQLARDIIDAYRLWGQQDKSGASMKFGPTGSLQNAAKRIQMQPAIEAAITIAKEQVALGHQVVLSLINVAEMNPQEGNIAAAIEMINHREVSNNDGEIIDHGDIPEALIARAELLEQAEGLGTFDNPLDLITDAFGADQVALIVGGGKGRQKLVADFQAGKRQVAVISAAGTTGINLDHVLKVGTGAQGRRVFIDVQYEWSASTAIQRYGRVDRSSSITQPKIFALNFGSASEKKFLATVANRMASLGALSKGGSESTGAGALEEFEITGDDALAGARAAWDALDEEDKRLWRGSAFENRTNPSNPVPLTRTTADMRQIQLGLLWLPIEKSNAFWVNFLEARQAVRDAMGYSNQRRAQRNVGEILREIELDANHSLFQVRNDNGERFGILQGLVMGDMPKLAGLIRFAVTGRHYATFTTKDGQIVAGLVVPWSRIKAVSRLYGRMLASEHLDTPEKVSEALNAGEKVELEHEGWGIRKRQDGKIAIDGAKMADRELVMKHGGAYSPVGNFWHVTDLERFLDRFPAKKPDVTVEATDEDPDDADDGGGVQSFPDQGTRGGGVRSLPVAGNVAGSPFPGKRPPATKAATPAMRPTHLVKALTAALGKVPVRLGHFRNRARGIYKENIRSIRLKTANDLRTFVHEAGHDFDIALLRLNRNHVDWKDELQALGQATSRPSYPVSQQRKEGAAEFFVLYMTDPDSALAAAPHYFPAFEAALDAVPELRDEIHEVRDNLRGYLGLSPAEQFDLNIDRDRPSDAAKLAAKVKADPRAAIRNIAVKTVNDLAWLKAAVEQMRDGRPIDAHAHANTLSRNARGTASKAEGFLWVGVRGQDGRFLGPSLEDALTPVRGRLDAFGNYLAALRVRELIQDRGRTRPGGTLVQAEDRIAKVEARDDFADFARARDLVYRFNDAVLDYAREYGALSKDQVRKIRSLNKAYVPLQRVMDAADDAFSGGSARKTANRSTPIHRIGDSNRPIIDPLESIIGNTFAMVDMVEKNLAMVALADQAGKSAGSAQWLEQIPQDQIGTKFGLDQITQDIRFALENAGLGDDLPDNLSEAFEDVFVTVFTPNHFMHLTPSGKQEGIVSVIRNGKRQFWQVNTPELYDAITQIGSKDTQGILRLVSESLTNILRTTATTTPSFIWRNVFRDNFVAMFQSRHGFVPVVDQVQAMISLARGTEAAKLFWTSGVSQATFVGMTRNQRADALRRLGRSKGEQWRDAVSTPIEFWRATYGLLQRLSSVVESSTRFAEFTLALEAGGQERGIVGRLTGVKDTTRSREEVLTIATLAAREVTTDFSHGGTAVKSYSRHNAFLNAQVQGYARMAETIKRDPVGVTIKLGMMGLFSAALWALNADDKEYQEKEEWEKHSYWFIPDGMGGFFKIAKPFDWAYLGADIWEAGLDYAKQGDATRFREMWESFFPGLDKPETIMSTVLNLLPTIGQPLAEAAFNYSAFREAPIVSPWDLDLPKDQQYTRWTSETAKLTQKYLLPFLSPAQIDHVLYGYTSNVGRGITDVGDFALGKAGAAPTKNLPAKPVGQWPVVGAFLDDGTYSGSSQSIQDVYDLAEAFATSDRAVRREMQGGKPDAALKRMLEAQQHPMARRRGPIMAARNEFTLYGRQIQAVYANTYMTPEQKSQRIYLIRERMVDTARVALGRRTLPSKQQGAR